MKDLERISGPASLAAGEHPRLDAPPPLTSGSRWVYLKERFIESLMMLAAFSSVLTTLGIVGILVYESSTFFAHVSVWDFLTDTLWTPLFNNPRFGILPLVAGTL